MDEQDLLEPVEPTVSFIRLVTGEDIVAEHADIEDDNAEYYLLINPMKLVYVMHEGSGSRVQVLMQEWIFPRLVAEQEFMVCAKDILTMAIPSKEILEYYWKMCENEPHELTKSKAHSAASQSLENDDDLGVSDEELEMVKAALDKRNETKKRLLN